MAYYDAETTVKGKGYPMTLGVATNGGTVTVSMQMTGAGAGSSVDHEIAEDGIYTFFPGEAEFVITPAGGAVYEITEG